MSTKKRLRLMRSFEDERDYDESQQNKGDFKFDDVYGGGNKRLTLLAQDETERRSEQGIGGITNGATQ
ncbi:hypothetical protein JOD02_001526 [Caldicoprobacter guelmensis]|uniref:hypothetical protein n=1 Tax=Caldicoprobacter guelmensis TaxID=1170224 RepID=UPI00195D9A57|nr:hypothetical protein [Caldicoprobacter guelmensis]MBM7582669.1 hypothetical protein [Caldicoprobacter guelmensis]